MEQTFIFAGGEVQSRRKSAKREKKKKERKENSVKTKERTKTIKLSFRRFVTCFEKLECIVQDHLPF